jgi:predicted negative regulator of RcsB-dependent stress response
VELYNSEEEQVEALKAWWDKNGTSVIIAIVVVLLAVFGWQTWQKQQRSQAESASIGLQKVMDSLQTSPDAALEAGRELIAKNPGGVYAGIASLSMARAAVEKGDLDGAVAYLQATLKDADQPELQQLARLNLSRVLLAQGKSDEALRELLGGQAGSMQAAYDELRGDIMLAQGKTAEARDAYINALAGFKESAEKKELVQLKLDDLAERVGE